MIRRFLYGGIIYLVLNALYILPTFAQDWMVWAPDPLEVEDYPLSYYDYAEFDLATPSDATYSDAFYDDIDQYLIDTYSGPGVSTYALGYDTYDGSISTSVVTYMTDVLPKLGNVSYVLFRSGQYDYRLVYAEEMEYSDGYFSADDADYIAYDSRYYTFSEGSEGRFSLTVSDYMVYSDLGPYPALASDSVYVLVVAMMVAVLLLWGIVKTFFSSSRYHLG